MMKKLLTLSAILLVSSLSFGQLIISQYIETNSGSVPKGIELFNNSGSTIDFAATNLVVLKGTNGGAPSSDFTLNTGTLADGEVMVIGTSDIATYLTGQGLGSVQFHTKAFTFNGDDALVIELGGTVEDVFGDPGTGDPGSNWNGSGVATNNSNIQVICSVIGSGDTDGWTDPSTRFETVGVDGQDLVGFGIAPDCGGGACGSSISLTSADCGAFTPGNDPYTATFAFTMGTETEALTVSATGGTPDVTTINADGTITVTGATEGTDVVLTLTNTNCTLMSTATSPVCISIPDLVISEISYNTAGTDDEWVEVCNNEGADVDVSGYTIDVNGTTRFTFPAASTITTGSCVSIALGSDTDNLYNNACEFTPDYNAAVVGSGTSNFLSNSAATISIESGGGQVDVVSYDDADGADDNGTTLHVIDIALDNSDTGTNWQEVLTGGSAGFNSLVSNCAPTNTILNFATATSSFDEASGIVSVCISITNPDPFTDTSVLAEVSLTSSATYDADYTDPNAVGFFFVQWPAGDGTDKCFDIQILEDLDLEGNESIVFNLTFESGGNAVSIGEQGQHNFTILDNDIPAPTPCGDLFISEYVEGSGNNKCIEIYNPSAAPIDLAAGGYALYSYNGGSASPVDTILLSGVLNPGEVYVVCNSGAGGVFAAEADYTEGFPTVVSFNGDDAIQLVWLASPTSFGVSLDVIGQIGVDPGTEWTGTGCSTLNTTLVRKSAIQQGDADGSDAFDPSVEWDCFAQDTDTEIGGHESSCIVSSCSISAVVDGMNQTACNSVDNTYSNDVIVTFSDAPAFGMLEVNGQGFAIGTSPQTVTLTGLISDGLPLDVIASFSADAGCTLTAAALFTSPANCLSSSIVINEVDYDQPGADTGEFVELYNTGTESVNLDPYQVVFVNGNGNAIYETFELPDFDLAPGEYFVLCMGANSSPYCDMIVAGDAPQGGPDAVGLNLFGNLVDALSYEGPVDGYVEGTAAANPGIENSASRIPNGSDTNDNSVDFVGACPTPGAANIICVDNIDCAGAFDVPVTEFSGGVGYFPYSTANSIASEVCVGTGDEVVWYSFVANSPNDILHVGVHPSLTPGFPTGFDAVVEVFDACDGASLGCFNNYGANLLERVLVGGLIPGNTYFFSVHNFSGAAGSTSKDFSIGVKTFAPHMLRGNYCGNLDYTLDNVIQAERDDLNEIYDFAPVFVNGYGFQFSQEGVVVAEKEQATSSGFYVQLANVSGLEYGQVYDVATKHRVLLHANNMVMNLWSEFGTMCQIGLNATIPPTQILNEFCGNEGVFYLEENILATPITGATAYEFSFDDGSTVITHPSNNYSVQLYQVDGLEYGKIYTITVRSMVAGAWSDAGPACTMTMAAKPENVAVIPGNCGMIYAHPSSEQLPADFVLGADAYEFRFTPLSGGAPFSEIRPTHTITLNSTVPLSSGDYQVDVRVFAGNVWGDFVSSLCVITIQGGEVVFAQESVEQSAEVALKSSVLEMLSMDLYPNPANGDEIMLTITSTSELSSFTLEILDITGKIVYSERFAAKGSSVRKAIQFEDVLETGIYFVRLEDGNQEHVEKLIVR